MEPDPEGREGHARDTTRTEGGGDPDPSASHARFVPRDRKKPRPGRTPGPMTARGKSPSLDRGACRGRPSPARSILCGQVPPSPPGNRLRFGRFSYNARRDPPVCLPRPLQSWVSWDESGRTLSDRSASTAFAHAPSTRRARSSAGDTAAKPRRRRCSAEVWRTKTHRRGFPTKDGRWTPSEHAGDRHPRCRAAWRVDRWLQGWPREEGEET